MVRNRMIRHGLCHCEPWNRHSFLLVGEALQSGDKLGSELVEIGN